MGLPRRPGRLLALEGPSGVGKSRAARALTDAIPGSLLLREAYDRLDPPPELAVPDRRALLRTERRLFRGELERYREAGEALRAGRTVVADTGFLGPLTYSLGLRALDGRRDIAPAMRALYRRALRNRTLGAPDRTVLLTLGTSALAARVASDPTGHPPALRARHAAIGRWEAQRWKEQLRGALGPRFSVVSAAGSSGAVVRRLLLQLGSDTRVVPLRSGARTELLAEMVRALSAPPARVKKQGRRGPTPRR